MRIVNLIQGSPEWHEHRARHDNASDAPVMMNESPYVTRAELVRSRALGTERAVNEFQQRIFDDGHASEAAHRANAEKVIGEALYPVVGVSEEFERMSASYDGLKMDGEVSWEHKLWSEELAAEIRAGEIRSAGRYWQLEHQFIVNPDLKRILFSCGDESGERFVHMWYTPIAGRREKVLAGWKQLHEDVANYEHRELPAPVSGRVVRALPALVVDIEGSVKNSNLALYRESALAYIEGINTTLKTDQDFADAEVNVKFCADAEKRIELAREQALSRTASIAEVLSTLDELRESLRQKRLMLNKLVSSRKDEIRAEIRDEAEQALKNHVEKINARFKKRVRLTAVVGDWSGAMKSKKSLQSLRDSVDAELARAKIEANEVAEKISANLAALDEVVGEHAGLFRDLQQLSVLDKDAFELIVNARISAENERRKAEKDRIEREAADRERARIAREQAAATQPPAGREPAPFNPAPPSPAARAEVAVKLTPSRDAPIARATEKPDDDDIIAVLCNHFDADEATVIGWIKAMDTKFFAHAA